jgi:hypothetical protein
VRRAIPWLAALLLAAMLGGCGDNATRDEVDAYIKQANLVQRKVAPRFKEAQTAYMDFSAGRLGAKEAGPRLAAAEHSIRGARDDIARLHPPSTAAELHRRLLRVFDLNLRMAHETTQLARYQAGFAAAVRRLRPAAARLQKALPGASTPTAQQALFAAYADALDAVGARLRALDPPPLLAAPHAAQLERMRAARTLTQQLRAAIGASDSKHVARVLLRFRRLNVTGTDRGGLPPGSVDAYNERLRELVDAQVQLRREEQRLNRQLQ